MVTLVAFVFSGNHYLHKRKKEKRKNLHMMLRRDNMCQASERASERAVEKDSTVVCIKSLVISTVVVEHESIHSLYIYICRLTLVEWSDTQTDDD